MLAGVVTRKNACSEWPLSALPLILLAAELSGIEAISDDLFSKTVTSQA